MKRIISSSLVCLFLCLMGSAIWTEASASESRMEAKDSSPENEYTYLAVLHRSDDFLVWDFIERNADTIFLDESRAVHAALFSSSVFTAMILPEGNYEGEIKSKVGALVTFDKPFNTFLNENGLEGIQILPGSVLEPKCVEIVGSYQYGTIVELGEDYMVLDIYDEYIQQSGNLTHFTITPDTLKWWADVPFQVGSGCEVIFDKDGVVLAMQEANG